MPKSKKKKQVIEDEPEESFEDKSEGLDESYLSDGSESEDY